MVIPVFSTCISASWGARKKRKLVPVERRTFVTFQTGNVKNCSYLHKIFKLISRASNWRLWGGKKCSLFNAQGMERSWEGSDSWLHTYTNHFSCLKLPPLPLVCAYDIRLRTSSSSLIHSSSFRFQICPHFSVLWEEAVLDGSSIQREDK